MFFLKSLNMFNYFHSKGQCSLLTPLTPFSLQLAHWCNSELTKHYKINKNAVIIIGSVYYY